jgi:protein gp37
MKDTKIRWSNNTWNPMTGCSKISPGCDHCYAEVIAEKFRGTAFPHGFEPTFKPNKLSQPRTWKTPVRIFVNSMSDVFHESFTTEQIDAVFDVMCEVDRHDYLLLTKRPQRMARYLLGPSAVKSDTPHDEDLYAGGYLARRGLRRLPPQVWLGTTIESDTYTWRADWLRAIPATVRFLSCEPLIAPVPSLVLAGISWVIAGGESGNGTRNFREMPHEWAAELRDKTNEAGAAFYFKQSSGVRTETGLELEGRKWEEYPFRHPAEALGDRRLGVFTDPTPALL